MKAHQVTNGLVGFVVDGPHQVELAVLSDRGDFLRGDGGGGAGHGALAAPVDQAPAQRCLHPPALDAQQRHGPVAYGGHQSRTAAELTAVGFNFVAHRIPLVKRQKGIFFFFFTGNQEHWSF